MKMIRWSFVSIAAIIVALIVVFNIFFFDKILKNTIISSAQMVTGAKVEIDYLKTSFKNCSITINGLRCADKNDYFKNLVDIKRVAFDVRFTPLLRKKVVIDEMSVEGIKLNTDRKTSGQLPPKQEKKYKKQENKDSKFKKLFNLAKEKTIKEANSLPSVEAFNIIQDQIKNFDADKLIEQTGLTSVKEAEAAYADLQKKYTEYQEKIKNNDYQEKIDKAKKLVDDISKTDFNSFNISTLTGTAQKISELKTIKTEFNNMLSDLNNIKKDVVSTVDISKQLKDSVSKDINNIAQKISLPNINVKNISQMLFGKKWVDRVEKIIYYISIVKQYLPEKSADEKELKQVKERALGRDVIFRQKLYPTLLIYKINVSGNTSTSKENVGIDFAGFIKNISSSPSMVAEPITFDINGNNAIQTLVATGLFDHRKYNYEDNITISLNGLQGSILNIEPNDYLPLLDTANVNFAGMFSLNNKGFLSKADVYFNNIKEKDLASISGNLKYLAEVTNTIKSFKVNLEAKTQDSDNLDMNITSDIDKKLSDAISKMFSAKVNEAKAKIQNKVNEITKAKIKEFEKSLQSQKDDLLKNINLETSSIEDITKQITNSIKGK
ncbi:MAG: TIGR03545 family protein [Elusimicrobia bacterium]|nr:TIGR03545 family protein [Elusimicrobiota bacterium]